MDVQSVNPSRSGGVVRFALSGAWCIVPAALGVSQNIAIERVPGT